MQFTKTQTFLNLAKSWSGECQAGMRYQLIAQKATQANLKTLTDEIKKIAKNETVHARRFMEMLETYGGNVENIDICAGYPFSSGTLEEDLCYAVTGEQSEAGTIYPEYAKTAKEEGFEDISTLFTQIAEVENQHAIIFNYLYEAVKNGKLHTSKNSSQWICSECGHIHVGKQAPKECPLCKMQQGYYELHLPYEGVKA